MIDGLVVLRVEAKCDRDVRQYSVQADVKRQELGEFLDHLESYQLVKLVEAACNLAANPVDYNERGLFVQLLLLL